MNYRNRHLLDLARGQPCMIRLDGICNNDPATVVSCHSNEAEHGHGKSIKAHDVFCAWGCSACHAEIDQGHRLNRAAKREAMRIARERTWFAMWQLGMLQVVGTKQRVDQPPQANSKILPRDAYLRRHA